MQYDRGNRVHAYLESTAETQLQQRFGGDSWDCNQGGSLALKMGRDSSLLYHDQ